jgi:hypothetical protein
VAGFALAASVPAEPVPPLRTGAGAYSDLFGSPAVAGFTASLAGRTLVTNGTGALVTYSATATAMPSPTSSPTMKPSSVPPDWRRKAT